VLNRLRTTNRLDRIVFDECHLLLNRDPSFRTAFLQLWELALMKTQLLFLIATMSPSRKSDFWRALRLASISPTPRTLRTTTTRVNIRYEVRSLLTRESVVSEVRRLIASVSLFDKILVFCTIVDLVESLAQELGSLRYHAKLADKNEMLRQFDRPKCRTMIAIIALSLELNKQDIDLIVHVDHSFSLLNYAQKSGRDERDERECHAVIVRASAKDFLIMDWPLRQYLWGTGSRPSCRRVTLNHYLDERIDRTQCEKNKHEELCDVCEAKASAPALAPASAPSTSGVNSASSVAYEAQQHRRNQIRMLALDASKQKTLTYEKQLRALKTLQGRCLLCDYLQGALHLIDECRSVNRAAYDAIKTWIQHTIRYERFFDCFDCGLPQVVCERWAPQRQQDFVRVRNTIC
jgi:superfamily II DNA helicase RecQ